MLDCFKESSLNHLAFRRAVVEVLVEHGLISEEEFWNRRFVRAKALEEQLWEEAGQEEHDDE